MQKVCFHLEGDLFWQSWNSKWPNLQLRGICAVSVWFLQHRGEYEWHHPANACSLCNAGLKSTSPELGTYCGTGNGSLTSTGKHMLIQLTSDATISGMGFTAHVKPVIKGKQIESTLGNHLYHCNIYLFHFVLFKSIATSWTWNYASIYSIALNM